MDITFFEEHKEKFRYLEKMREIGTYNSWMLSLPLQEQFELSHDEAARIHNFWIEHCIEIRKNSQPTQHNL